MKKIIFTVTVLFAFVVNAHAINYPWADTINFTTGNGYVGWFDTKTGTPADITSYFFDFKNVSLDWSHQGIKQLNKTGTLDVSNKFRWSNFSLVYSEPAANGIIAAPAPESGTMVLLGFGLLGLAVYGKRRMNKES